MQNNEPAKAVDEPARSMRHYLGALARILICVLILTYLLKKLDMQMLGNVLGRALSQWPWLMAGLVLTFIGLCVGAARWHVILIAQGLRQSLLRVFRIYFIGQFFNAFMLGACGGDVARAYYASCEMRGKRTEAISTVFVDRAVGLFAMIVFCCIMIILRINLFIDYQGTRWPGILMFVFLIGALAAIFALFRRNLFEHWHFFRRLEQDTRFGPLIRRAYEALYLYRRRHRILAIALLFSLLNLAFLTFACYSFGRSLEIDLSAIDYFTVFPIISVLAAVPITPGGLGVREGLFVAMLQDVNIDPLHSLPLSLMNYAGGLAWSLFGGLLFLGFSTQHGHTMRAELDAIQHEHNPVLPDPSAEPLEK